ncbi:MAG: DUF2797 domain-containing protein [Methanobacteriota archaeon]|nr:MAG: DUF2797 domain-containing protein [Euryarchaeota archaeon]
MFERADLVWLSQIEDSLPYHALDFGWRGFEPNLTCVDRDGAVTEMDLGEVDFVISRRRECVGRFDGDRYISCPRRAPVTRFAQCAECAEETFIPHQECIFEPKCDGELCDVEFCRREHVLYLAFYDTKVKVGMSSSRRLSKRLIEQGADAFSVIGSYPTRRSARTAEKEISSSMRVPQAFRQEALLKSLAREVDVTGIERRHSSLSESLESRFGLKAEPIQWLDRYPVELPLNSVPHLEETPGRHRGEAVGVKGRWLIYRSSRLNALDLSDVPSRFVGVAVKG